MARLPIHRSPTLRSTRAASDLLEPITTLEPLGGASGTLESMLEAADRARVTLPLSLGLAVLDEVRLMQAALDHCRIFLDRVEANHRGDVEYVAARALITATLLQAQPHTKNGA